VEPLSFNRQTGQSGQSQETPCAKGGAVNDPVSIGLKSRPDRSRNGLAGSSLAASLGEMGYRVTCFCFQDTARRAHSVAAQGGVNACKNYKNDGDTVFRMFYDTIKGGDFRSREANVYRLAECSAQLIDQAVAQGVPFAREYSGYLSNARLAECKFQERSMQEDGQANNCF
jgi:succinate dehydrogenase/fumarate reductase flavoprotein subunit